VNDSARLDGVNRPYIVALGRWPQPRCDNLAPGQITENDRDDDQSHHGDSNKCADKPGEKPPHQHADKNACHKPVATPLEAPAFRSTHIIASVHRDPRNASIRSFEPLWTIDQSSEYRTSTQSTFTFHAPGGCHSGQNEAYRHAFRFPVGYPPSRLGAPAPAPRGRLQTTIDEALEAAETPAAPCVLADIVPLSQTVAPQPVTPRRMLSLATQIVGEDLMQTLVGAVDTFMVAHLGAAAVAGVGTGFEIVFFIISILSAIAVGATVLVCQAIGAGDRRRANQLARQAIGWGLILTVPVSVGVYLLAPSIVALFGTEPNVAEAATTYIEITAATSVALFLSFVCGAVLRGAGESRTPLAAAVLANIVNIAVAYTLIFGNFGFPALGVAGSAITAAAGRGIAATYMLLVMALGKKAISLRGSWGWRPHVSTGRQFFRLGIPAAVEQMLSSGAFMVLLAVVARIGTPALAAQDIAFTALSTAFLPGIAFSVTATALVGQSIGARLPANARKAWGISLR
jgi:putative MATE family efflux protein